MLSIGIDITYVSRYYPEPAAERVLGSCLSGVDPPSSR